MSDGGKGSAPRKQQDQEAYSSGWDRIFGKKNEQKTTLHNQDGSPGTVCPSGEMERSVDNSGNQWPFP